MPTNHKRHAPARIANGSPDPTPPDATAEAPKPSPPRRPGEGLNITDLKDMSIQKLTQIEASLTDYRIRAVTKGKEAMGEVQIELEHTGRKIRGRGLSTDILEASALAYLAAINRLRSLNNRERLVTQQMAV